MIIYKSNPMKKSLFTFILCLTAMLISAKDYIDINAGWKFNKASVTSGQSTTLIDDAWQSVDLPHSWNAIDGQDGGSNYYRGDGWYRKKVTIPTIVSGARIYIDIAAANMTTTVYVNGSPVGIHTGGYARFVYDITGNVTPGQQALIAIKINNADVVAPPRSADFTFSGGLHRDVRLIIANDVHIAPKNDILTSYLLVGSAGIASPGVKIRQYDVDKTPKIDVTTRVRNSSTSVASTTAQVLVYDRNGNEVAEATKSANVNANSNVDFTSTLTINNAHLWNGVNDPYLYKVVVILKKGNVEVDRSVQPLGLRYFSADINNGFFLNGKSYPLRGIAFHDELIDKGRASTDAERKRDLDILRRMGTNYIRISHYQHGDYTYNYCDSVGIICWTEIPVINYMCDASAQSTFQQNAATQLYELIRQQYNHPSVCFWGLCNEIRATTKTADVVAVITQLNNLAHSEDNTRLTTLAHDKAGATDIANYGEWNVPDVISFNKYCDWYEGSDIDPRWPTVHSLVTTRPLGVSEYGAGGNPFHHGMSPNKGIGGQYHPEEFQAQVHQEHLDYINKNTWMWETSAWAGFDFASDGRSEGERLGINDKGLVNHERAIKKDAYFLYMANWNKNEGVVHIKNRRYIKPGTTFTVETYSNCSDLKLTVNGVASSMTSSNSTIKLFKVDNVQLISGTNIVVAEGTFNGKKITDTVIWYVGTAGNSIEAENGSGGTTVADASSSNLKRVEVPQGVTHQITYNAPVDGVYTAQIFYMTVENRSMNVSANGYTARHMFGETGSWNADKQRDVCVNVYLKKGNNTIEFTNPDGACPNLDKIVFYNYHDGILDPEDNDYQKLIPISGNPNVGEPSLIANIIEAELAQAVNGSKVGLGTGTYNSNNEEIILQAISTVDGSYSGGKKVSNLGFGNKLVFTYDAAIAGIYDMGVFYATGQLRNVEITVNGTKVSTMECASTGDYTTVVSQIQKITLNKGINTIELGNEMGFCPDLDYITLKFKEITDIKSVYNNAIIKDSNYYNIKGQRVARPVKGIVYIHGGQKVLLK